MKLAEALLERKSLMEKVESLRGRLMQNALVQEGDAPAEEPQALLIEMTETIEQLGGMIRRINATNNVAVLPDGSTVSESIVRRDMLNLRRTALEQLAKTAAVRQSRVTRAEVKFVPTVNAADLRRQADALAKAWRDLDAQIQAVNWNSELI